MKQSLVSFEIEDVEGYVQFFRENGYVVVRGVLSPAEVADSIKEIWESPNFLHLPGLDREDPDTWEAHWPGTQSARENRGFFSSLNDFDDTAAWANRQNPKIVKIFQDLLARELLWAVTGRFNVMRPTKDIRRKDGSLMSRPEWRTSESWLHWDQNPWREPAFCRVQGLLSLTTQTGTSGGFCCVPGFQKDFKAWSESHPMGEPEVWGRTLVYVPEEDPIQKEKVAILMDAGSLLIWDSRLPHQNYPNNDHNWRIVQYCTYDVVDHDKEEEVKKKIRQKISSGLTGKKFPSQLSLLGRKLMGINLWKGDEEVVLPPQLSPGQLLALEHFQKAQDLEIAGQAEEAALLYRKAFKLNPTLEYCME